MQENLIKQLSEMTRPGKDPSTAIRFTHLGFSSSPGFKPSSASRKTNTLDTIFKQVPLLSFQTIPSSLFIDSTKYNEAYVWPMSAFGLIKITCSDPMSTTLWRLGVMIGPNLVLTTVFDL